MRVKDWYTITGRGRVAVVDLRDIDGCPERINDASQIPIDIGEHVMLDGDEYEVRGIEYTTALMSPPFITPDVGLVVVRIEVDDNEE